VKPAIFLDSGPLGLLAHIQALPAPLACRNWITSLAAAGRRVFVPETVDYEVRRELLRIQSSRAVARLDTVAQQLEYLPLTTSAMRRAAELWCRPGSKANPPRLTIPSTWT
jgi:hypothetical protein